jgi:hypothetical protein
MERSPRKSLCLLACLLFQIGLSKSSANKAVKLSKFGPYKIKAIQLIHSEASAVLQVVVKNQVSIDLFT